MVDRLRLSLFCPTCLPGYHLPFFSAAVSGLFSDYGLIVEILDPPPPPGSTNATRVATGDADFCLTGVNYFLQARREAGDVFPARFVSVIHQRSPLGAIVPADSGIRDLADLAGLRLGRGEYTGWLADECAQVLADRGIGAPRLIALANGEAPGALGRGEVDMVATYVDAMTRVGVKGGLSVRALPLGLDVYGSGMVAADGLPLELVERMRAALAAAFALRGPEAEAGIAEYCERFPDVRPADVRESGALLVPYVEHPDGVGSMTQQRWTATLEWADRTHGYGKVAPERVYRTELAHSSSDSESPAAGGVAA